MASRDLESQVIYVIADERGLAREKVHLSDRLLRDLGMDGDDAVDFFISVHERFGTDLTHLQEHWGQHFGPEGFSCWNGLILLLAAIIGGVVARVAGLSAFWGVGVAVGLLAAWVLRDRRIKWSLSRLPMWSSLSKLERGPADLTPDARNGWRHADAAAPRLRMFEVDVGG